jgi:hypothetical protein
MADALMQIGLSTRKRAGTEAKPSRRVKDNPTFAP